MKYFKYSIVGFIWGAISYPAIWFSGIPVLGWVLAAPSFFAADIIVRFNLPFSRDFGQYGNTRDWLFVSLLTPAILVILVFCIRKCRVIYYEKIGQYFYQKKD